MSSTGYIYIKNWDRYQYRADRRLPWIKLYAELLDDDDFLALSLADRGLLQDLWKLASLSGDGRVSADRVSLARRLNVRRVSLDTLIQAGYIDIRAHKRRRESATEQNRAEETATTAEPSSEVLPSRTESANGSGTAVEPIKETDPDLERWQTSLIIRTDPLGRLVATIGKSCDKNTETTIRNLGATEHELHQARESLERLIPAPGNSAGYVVNALKSMIAERGGHLKAVPTEKGA